jgi:hypothetical protein
VPILTGLTPQSIAAVGQRGRDLLQTLAHNRRKPLQPLFEATAVSAESDGDMVSFVRREITAQGMDFINGAISLLNRSELKKAGKVSANTGKCRLGVTIFYFEDEVEVAKQATRNIGQSTRKNLRRQRAKTDVFKTSAK